MGRVELTGQQTARLTGTVVIFPATHSQLFAQTHAGHYNVVLILQIYCDALQEPPGFYFLPNKTG